jgi:hypothetical protein
VYDYLVTLVTDENGKYGDWDHNYTAFIGVKDTFSFIHTANLILKEFSQDVKVYNALARDNSDLLN